MTKIDKKQDKAEKRAHALRDNLRKRKAVTKAKSANKTDDDTKHSETTKG